MSFDLQKILESKRALRRKLAAKPLAEKMRLLDQLSERAAVIKRSRVAKCADAAPVPEGRRKLAGG